MYLNIWVSIVLNIPSGASGDRRTLQSRDIYSKEVAWTVELSVISLQSNEHLRVQKLCHPEQHPDPHNDKVGLLDLKYVLNFKNVNNPIDCVVRVYSSPACCVLPADQVDQRGTVHHHHCCSLDSGISGYGWAGTDIVHQLCLPASCKHTEVYRSVAATTPWFFSKSKPAGRLRR